MRLRVLVVQTYDLPDTLSDEELEKAQDEIRAQKVLPDSIEWLAYRIGAGPVTRVGDLAAFIDWLSSRREQRR